MEHLAKTAHPRWSAHVKTCLRKYAAFGGRATRGEFWCWALFVAAVAVVLYGMMATLVIIRSLAGPDLPSNPLNWLSWVILPLFLLLALFLLFTLLPTLAVTVRRLRDAGFRPWIVILPLLLLVGAFWPALVVALSGMGNTPPEIPLPYCYAYLGITAAVCLLYAAFLCRDGKEE